MDKQSSVSISVEKDGKVTIERNGNASAIVVLCALGIAKTLEDGVKGIKDKEEQMDTIADNLQAITQTMIHRLRDEGYSTPGLLDIALINEAYDYFDTIGKPIDVAEARRITEAVMDNDSIWEEMHGLMTDIHEEI